MNDERLSWLLECANRLNAAGGSHRVSIRPILERFGVDLEKRVDPTARAGSGAMVQSPDGKYRVLLKRKDSSPKPLSHRERFTLAHELGHILLAERFGWTPAQGPDYYKCENWCDLFAAHLLIPEAAIEQTRFATAKDALAEVSKLTAQLAVSLEVTCRRAVEQLGGLGFLEARECTNAKRERVLELGWGASSIPQLKLTRRLHLRMEHPVAAAVLDGPFPQYPEECAIPGIGTASGRLLYGRKLVAIAEDGGGQRGRCESPGSCSLD